jgi:hypothetical protein
VTVDSPSSDVIGYYRRVEGKMFVLEFIRYANGQGTEFTTPSQPDRIEDGVGEGEGLLRSIDRKLSAFAGNNNLVPRTTDASLPSRTLEWTGDVDRMLQIYLEDEDALTFTMWICAKQDRAGKRYLKALALRDGVPFRKIKRELSDLLEAGYRILASWTESDLEFTIDLPEP